ncbi:MAG: hypothetical protein GXY07_15450 [Candidatus Hydrogenedentes bacterium]|nr:hypothetical protein [Candidatus Hydrogenedentota bacterium]
MGYQRLDENFNRESSIGGKPMRGVVRKQKCGYEWMRVGYADAKFTLGMTFVSLSTILGCALWGYKEIPETEWRLTRFLAVYFIATVLYLNLGVWIHEQLHCLAFRRTVYAKRTHITYIRQYVLALSGHYWVTGAIDYRTMRRALSGPLILVVSSFVVGGLGGLILPGWWFPIMITMAVVSLLDMIHDFYWLLQIRLIGDKGKYWDNGSELEVVWKE